MHTEDSCTHHSYHPHKQVMDVYNAVLCNHKWYGSGQNQENWVAGWITKLKCIITSYQDHATSVQIIGFMTIQWNLVLHALTFNLHWQALFFFCVGETKTWVKLIPQPCIARIASHEGSCPVDKQNSWVLPLKILFQVNMQVKWNVYKNAEENRKAKSRGSWNLVDQTQ